MVACDEVLYVGTLRLEAGATLITNGCDVYFEEVDNGSLITSLGLDVAAPRESHATPSSKQGLNHDHSPGYSNLNPAVSKSSNDRNGFSCMTIRQPVVPVSNGVHATNPGVATSPPGLWPAESADISRM